MLLTQSISRARVTNLKVDYGELDCPCHDRLGPFSLYPIPSTLKKVSVFAYYSPEAQKLICRDIPVLWIIDLKSMFLIMQSCFAWRKMANYH